MKLLEGKPIPKGGGRLQHSPKENSSGLRILTSMSRSIFVVLFSVAVALIGCNTDPGPVAEDEPSVPASGMVTFKGQPLSGYQVVLMPEGDRRPAMGVTDTDGKFTLGTNAPGDGAPPGSSKVAIVWAGPESTVDAVEQSAIDDPSRMPKPSVSIPPKYSNPETSGLTAVVPEAGTSELKFELQ
jgi:hypothetical protein